MEIKKTEHSKGIVFSSVFIFFITVFFLFNLTANAYAGPDTKLTPEEEEVIAKAESLRDSGDKAGAAETLLDFISSGKGPISEDMSLALGRVLYNYNYADEALSLYEEAYKTYPESGKLLRAYTGLLFKEEMYSEAAPLMEKVYSLDDSKNVMHLILAANGYYLANKMDDAKRVLLEAEVIGPPSPQWYSAAYQVFSAMGEADEAEGCLEKYKEMSKRVMIKRTETAGTPPPAGALDNVPSDSQDIGTVFNIDELDEKPKIVHMLLPMYPVRACVEGITGRVLVKLVIDSRGFAQEPGILSATPEGYFEESALDAIMEYRFIPAKKDGKYVSCLARIPVAYKLDFE